LGGLLVGAGAGDDLQGIKKGILEMADMIAVNKADGDNQQRAELAASDYRAALHLLTPASPTWSPPVLSCSGMKNQGLNQLWQQIVTHRDKMGSTGELAARRSAQQVRWLNAMLDDRLRDDLRSHPDLLVELDRLETAVEQGEITATSAVDRLWAKYQQLR